MDFVYFFREKFLFVIGKNNIFLSKIIYRKKFIIGNNFKVWGSIRILIDGLGKIKIGSLDDLTIKANLAEQTLREAVDAGLIDEKVGRQKLNKFLNINI